MGRFLAAGMIILLLGGCVAQAASGGGEDLEAGSSATTSAAKPKPPPELPRGGRKLFPAYRVVGFYGAPQDEELGALGIGTPTAMTKRLAKAARPYRRGGRPIMP